MLYVRRNFKNMTIDLANAFRFCIDIPTQMINIEIRPALSRGYRLTNFWLAEKVNKEVKKKLHHQCL
jgi:hypothetical protein